MDPKKIKVDLSAFNRDAVTAAEKIKLTPAGCALDLGDGSERAEYVDQDYILNKLGRPHRNIGLMYTYYPKDKQWPERISDACADMEIKYQWDYPYDDYFPYGGGIGGNLQNEPFNQMRDIRRHGQDVTLTITIDCTVEDEHLIQIAKDLRTFGRMRLRINHECSGTWFTHNQRSSYKEIADFFIRFHNIIKEYAPNVETIFCAGFITDEGKVEQEDEFARVYKVADVWSGDRYLALHFGWPFDICEKDTPSYMAYSVENYIDVLKRTAERLDEINGGVHKPFVASEFNTDGDVTGPVEQGIALKKIAKYLSDEKVTWFNSMSMYQFRDRGRLGLEVEDPNNSAVGIEQPMLEDYKEVMKMPFFQPGEESLGAVDKNGSVELRWGGAEDSEGVKLKVKLEKTPVFFDIKLPKEQNLMIEVNGRWFYKSPGLEVIDAMPAFFGKDALPVKAGDTIDVRVFTPPFDGENHDDGREDWAVNSFTTLEALPEFRIRYEACAEVK